MKREWTLKALPTGPLPDMPEYPELVVRLLALRGITTAQAAIDFLNPEYSDLLDPHLFKDMAKAVDRIWRAVTDREKIVIYADYDADAITASSVMALGLQKLGAIVDCYIPDRFAEGYGMNLEAIQKIRDDGAGLVITVDCGTNSTAEADLCREIGLDLIITDHHEITGDLPQAFALVNPKNSTDNYPFRFLTGVGVAFKVIQALFASPERQKLGDVPDGWEKWLLDLVAIGTVADLQSLTSENRILVHYGLQVLGKSKWPGVKALLATSKAPVAKFTAHTLGFVLAPRINAAGRIKHADAAYKLLISQDEAEASQLAQELDALNTHRQVLTEQILSEAREQVSQQMDRQVLLAAGQDWPKGVVGLVAGRLAEEFGKPVLVMDKGEEFATGSARSHPRFDLVAALTHAKDLLVKYGGHTQAAGFTLASGDIEKFHQRLLEFADSLPEDQSAPVLEADAEMTAADFNWETYGHLERFEPFGIGNPRPKVIGRGLQVVEARTVGQDAKHLKLRLLWDGRVAEGIAFRQGYLAALLKPNQAIDAVFEIEANEWNGRKDLQMKITDINADTKR